jgi:glutamate synthase (NADPH) large chain
MGTDTPLAVLSERPRLLFDYFAQLFAQVTNPPLDAIREEVVTAVSSSVGSRGQSARARTGELPSARAAVADHRQRRARQDRPRQRRRRVPRTREPRGLGALPGLGWRSCARRDARPDLCRGVAGHRGRRPHHRAVRPQRDEVAAPIPSLLLTSAVHHHLMRTKQRTMVGLVVECGDAREVHHMALLIGYGAGAINPYLAFESIEDLIAQGLHGLGDVDPPRRCATTSRRAARACSR